MDAWQRLGGGFWFISLFVLEIKAIHINFEVTTHNMFCRVVRSKGLMLPSQRDTGKRSDTLGSPEKVVLVELT